MGRKSRGQLTRTRLKDERGPFLDIWALIGFHSFFGVGFSFLLFLFSFKLSYTSVDTIPFSLFPFFFRFLFFFRKIFSFSHRVIPWFTFL